MLNKRCPKCGSMKVQMSNERSKNGCLWFLLFGVYWCIWKIFKCMIGLTIFMCWDWWMTIVKFSMGKGYIWKSKR